MMQLRLSEARGYADSDWLKSYHSFSFGRYYDEKHMQFSSLRVINDDQIAGGGGFGMHGHRDMEIVTYMLSGTLTHEDSMGHGATIQAGDVQCMTAGSGIRHSEVNADPLETAHLLQIWIVPATLGLTPHYAQRHFSQAQKENRWCLIVSPTGEDGAIKIHQDAYIYASVLSKSSALTCTLNASRSTYLHVVRGAVDIDGKALKGGDALLVEEMSSLAIVAQEDAELLWFDLP